MRLKALTIIAAIAFLPISAMAQEEPQPTSCAQTDKALPQEMAGWAEKADLTAAPDAAGLAKAELVIGLGENVTLLHTPQVTYPMQPLKPGGSVSYGGLLGLTIKQAGTYRIGLSSGAWIDVVKDETLVQSTGHGHGPACSTLRKIVDFPLEPGRYIIQVSANSDATLATMVWRQP
jgi:hypothetical protein